MSPSSAQTSELASGPIIGADELSVQLIQPDGMPAVVRINWPLRPTTAAAAHYPAVAAAIVKIVAESATALARHKGGRTMSNDIKAFLLSVGGLLAVGGTGLLVLWAVLS